MRKIKKILYIFIILSLALGLSGCGSKLPPNTVFSAEDLRGKVVGVLSGSAAVTYIGEESTVRAYASAEAVLRDVKLAALDCAVMDEAAAKAGIKRDSKLKILSAPLVDKEFCFVTAKENQDLRKAVNSALAELKEDGTLKRITDAYLLGGGETYQSPASADHSKGTLTLAVSARFPPYSFINDDGQTVGLDIDIARAVCDKLRVNLKVAIVKKEELINHVQVGKADFALGGLEQNDADEQLIDFSNPYAVCRQVIVVRR
jgi:polar amino acid transport system substrate-binding protein